jgi:outer membrane protein
MTLLFASPAFALKVGVVNLQRALQESKQGQGARASLEKEFTEKRDKIEAERTALQKASEEFQKKSAVLAEKARQKQGGELQQRMAAFQELVQKSQSDIQGREAQLTKPILDGLRGMVADVAKKKDVELVVEETSGVLLYADKRVDLTDDVIKAYDAKK